MLFRTIASAALAACLASPLAALDLSSMSDAEREAFRAEVRAYLVENPEVILEAIQVLEQRQAAAQAEGDLDLVRVNADEIFDDGFSFVGGNPDGDITVVEFLDYRCGYCRKAHPDVTELIASDGNIRYVVKEFPILGEQSVLAARYAMAVLNVEGAEVYARVHDRLMTFRGDFTEESLSAMSQDMGLNGARVFEEMNSPVITDRIQATRALAQRLQINGTPSFVFETEMMRGYAPLDAMRELVAQVRGS